MKKSVCLAVLLSTLLMGCQPAAQGNKKVPAAGSGNDLAAARKDFVTRLKTRGPAPQVYQNRKPPEGVKEVFYTSGNLSLKGWLSESSGEKKRPAVVYLHGGWAFGDGDWEDSEAFVKAGFIVFMPMLRAENGNPGIYESFLGEVDDAIAAGQYLAKLPNVDTNNIFVTGHSVGAVLSSLVSMLPSPYKAAAAYDGFLDMTAMAAESPLELIPFDRRDQNEIRVRNPLAFAASIRCPLRLYATREGSIYSSALQKSAKEAGKDCEMMVIHGDHMTMVKPAVQETIKWFKQLMNK
jgi:dipeptidyl aminopeptidase/acylaminoacyl peptidase